QPAEASAGKVLLRFAGQQLLQTVHAEEGVRLTQKKSTLNASLAAQSADAQDIELTAPAMDFAVQDGRLIQNAETDGPPQIVIAQPSVHQQTTITAGKFTFGFNDQNRLTALHGEPDAKIVTRTTGQPDRVSASRTLDVAFQPTGGVSSVTQEGD